LGTGDPTVVCWASALLLAAGIRCQHSRRLKKGLGVAGVLCSGVWRLHGSLGVIHPVIQGS